MMDEELKNIFDDITKRIQEEEDNAIAKAFTLYIGDCLRREGIIPILTKVEAPCQEISNGNEYKIVSRYGYIFERLDTSEHDKQIRDEVIDEFIKLCDSYCHFNANKHPSNGYVISRASLLDIAEKMKGEQNE